MQVKRNIGGLPVIVQLTREELFAAYQEQQRLLDIENIHGELELWPDSDLIEKYGLPLNELEPLEDEMAAELRSNINKEMLWVYALADAINSVVNRHVPPS